MEKRIITLTTDFGIHEGYVGAMKGVILSINPDVVLVDISHQISRHDIFAGAFMLHSSYKYFPKDSIHLTVIDPGVGGKRKPILVEAESYHDKKKYYFVGPDNGVFTFIYRDCKVNNIIEIRKSKYTLPSVSDTFHGRDIFAPIAAHLSCGVVPSKFGKRIKRYKTIAIKKPKVTDGVIDGEVVYTDTFGNIITNISKKLVEEKLANRNCQIKIGKRKILKISRSYSDAKKNELLALFGSSDFLEIAINKGDAGKLLKLGLGKKIRLISTS